MQSGLPPPIKAETEKTFVAPRNRLGRGRVVVSSGNSNPLLCCEVSVLVSYLCGVDFSTSHGFFEEFGNPDSLCSGPASAIAA